VSGLRGGVAVDVIDDLATECETELAALSMAMKALQLQPT